MHVWEAEKKKASEEGLIGNEAITVLLCARKHYFVTESRVLIVGS